MEMNENFVEQTENVEQTTEQTQQEVKTYTQEEVDAIVGKRLARQEARIRKENDRKYGGLMEVLKVGTGKESVEEVTDTFRGFYQQKGIKIPQKPAYTERDVEVLAQSDAAEIINAGYEEVVEEVDRLTAIGFENMTQREKVTFKTLAEHRQSIERGRELSSIGVPEDVYNSDEFKKFAAKFKNDIPITEIYEDYRKTQPKTEHKSMGSMKSNVPDTGLKEFYSFEEASKFSKADFDKNPALYKRVVESMTKW